MNPSRVAAAVGLVLVAMLPALAVPPAQAQTTAEAPGVLVLPKPVGEIPLVAPEVVTPERRRTTFVPGAVRDDERIEVQLSPDGVPARLLVTQRLELTGTGDFAVRERGPALRVTALDGTTAPIIQRGTVVWQGFVPGRRLLAARLELDPAREALLLPLRVELAWTPKAGTAGIGPGGRIRSAGRLAVRLINQTARTEQLPTGLADAAAVAPALDRLRAHSAAPSLRPPPAAGRGLPTSVPVTGLGARTATVAAPLRITGSVTVRDVTGVQVSGPGTTPTAGGDGATLGGVLEGQADIALDVPAAGDLVLDLTVVAALDPRRLEPPDGAATWAAWAATQPPASARRAAVDTLVDAAAAAARADGIAPYLGHPGPGETTTEFRYVLAPAPRIATVRQPLSPRPVPIAATALLLIGVAGGGVAVWRKL